MRGILIMGLLAASLIYGAANDYVEVRDLRLPADGIDELTIDDGSGSINVSDVAKDLIIEDDGSGSLNFERLQGRVEKLD